VSGESEIGPIRGSVGGVPEFVLINGLTRSLHKAYIHTSSVHLALNKLL